MSAKRLPLRTIVGLPATLGLAGADRDPDRRIAIAERRGLAVEACDADGGADHGVQLVLIGLQAPAEVVAQRKLQHIIDAPNPLLQPVDNVHPDFEQLYAAVLRREVSPVDADLPHLVREAERSAEKLDQPRLAEKLDQRRMGIDLDQPMRGPMSAKTVLLILEPFPQ